jgi:caffeoyl-CoA O-methyltransferase
VADENARMSSDVPRQQRLFGAVEQFVEVQFSLTDPALDNAIAAAGAAGLPQIQISAAQGRFLQIMALAVGARRILEIGTLGGYSTIWLGRALKADGELLSLEIDPARAEVARSSIAAAGLAARVEVRTGPAIDSLRALIEGGAAPFDLVFIDADEPSYVSYLEAVLSLSRPGTLIVADNVVREGEVIDSATDNQRAIGARRFLDALAAEPRVEATVLPLIGKTSFDGMAIARVRQRA